MVGGFWSWFRWCSIVMEVVSLLKMLETVGCKL